MQIKSRSHRMKNVSIHSQIPNEIPLNMRNGQTRNNNVSLNLTISLFLLLLLSSFLLFSFFFVALCVLRVKRDCLPLKLKFLLESHKEIESLYSFLSVAISAWLCKPYCICTLLYQFNVTHSVSSCLVLRLSVLLCKIDSGSWRWIMVFYVRLKKVKDVYFI